jgi:hypothetical protein
MTSPRRFDLIIDGGITLALLTAFLYASHTAHNHGYLIAFGIDTTIIEKSFYRALYDGLLILINFSIIPATWQIVISLFISLSIMLYAIFAKYSIKNKRVIVKLKREFLFSTHLTKVEKLGKNIIDKSFYTFISFLVFILILWHFEKTGAEEARRLINQYKTNTISESNLVNIGTGESINTLFIVDCGSDLCAGIDMVKGNVVYFNKKNQKRLTSKISISQ